MSKAGKERSKSYIHGSKPEEQQRLSRLNDLLNQASLSELKLHGGEAILDVGSGIAQLTRAMARAAGHGARVLGIERDADQIAEARRQAVAAGEAELVELRHGNALELPLREDEWGSFDLAHTRFLLEHVSDPLAVVRGMVRAVRPGGRIALADDDHDVLRLWPEPPGVMPLWQAYMRSYDRLGNDPYVGRRLVWLLHAAGAIPVRNNWIFFGSCAGSPAFGDIVWNLEKILVGARALIVATGQIEEAFFDEAIAALRTWSSRADAAFWFAMCWAEGRRPEGRTSEDC
jgi:ubiquinone/menaquinone biosynthesis C-methylase UbiE